MALFEKRLHICNIVNNLRCAVCVPLAVNVLQLSFATARWWPTNHISYWNTSTLLFLFSDLAARNCLVFPDLSVKIGDFGISRCVYKVCCDFHMWSIFVHILFLLGKVHSSFVSCGCVLCLFSSAPCQLRSQFTLCYCFISVWLL